MRRFSKLRSCCLSKSSMFSQEGASPFVEPRELVEPTLFYLKDASTVTPSAGSLPRAPPVVPWGFWPCKGAAGDFGLNGEPANSGLGHLHLGIPFPKGLLRLWGEVFLGLSGSPRLHVLGSR